MAIAFMAEDPARAEPVLRKAATDPVGKLDLVLFLHSFRPDTPARRKEISTLLAGVRDPSAPVDPEIGELKTYDGTDQSLLAYVEQASLSGAANSDSAFYAIPCAVLIARPGLVEATRPLFGSNKDNFLPRSGCSYGRGTVKDFPDAEAATFILAATEADGHFIENFGGSMKYGLESAQNATLETMKVDPRWFLKAKDPTVSFPYQTWGYISLSNHAVSLHLRSLYEVFLRKLIAYDQHLGLTAKQAARAARNAIFQSVWGAECGGRPPQKSARSLLIDRAPADIVMQWLSIHGAVELPEIAECAKEAGIEPLLLVAVGDPAALPLVFKQAEGVDQKNSIGKTALMAAAQFDEVESARFLLAQKAEVNAHTWQTDEYAPALFDDARTPLMYAAANASLPLIKVLLAAGADLYQADTKGFRAIDYLLGFGPTSPNPRLSTAERAEALSLLF